MNKIVLMGRLTKDPEMRYSQGINPMAVTKYILAVDRRVKKDDGQSADFIECVAFNKSAEFAQKYFKKGMKVCVSGRLQIDIYKNKEDKTVYRPYVVLDNQEFAQSKSETKETNALLQEDDYLPF